MLTRLLGAIIVAGSIFVIWLSIQSARADLDYRENTLPSLRKAVAIAPENAAFRALLAEQLEAAGEDPQPQLVETTRLSPLESEYWIRRALQEELEGRDQQAETFLLQAAKVDVKSAPRWALMNFYFRHGRDAEFWASVTKALTINPGDVGAIFRLAWDRSQNGAFIFERIPHRPDLMVQYLDFLSRTDRLNDSDAVALQVAQSVTTPTGSLLAYCDRYAVSDSSRALPVWNVLCQRKLLPFGALNPAEGKIITNPDLAVDPSRRGFDWKLKSVDGIEVESGGAGAGFHVEMTGSQPEDAVIMEEPVPLAAGRTYLLSWESGSQSGESSPGLMWEIVDFGSALPPSSAAISGTGSPQTGTFAFRAASDTARLRLRYQRPLGTVRAKGTVVIRGLRAAVQP